MISKIKFLENLELTQKYCQDKIEDKTKNLASILRTINPIMNGKPIFEFEIIDTWFYIDRENNLLFSWIPKKYIDLIEKAVDVSFIDMFGWMDRDYEELYLSIFDKNNKV